MAYEIRGTHQISRSRTTTASVEALWGILSDSRRLPEWVPAVHQVDRCREGGEAAGAVRQCSVQLGGRRGTMIEECVEIVPPTSITYAVRSDTLGMDKVFRDYCFRISLRREGASIIAAIDTYYSPRNAVYALMNVAFLRRRFRGVVDEILEGLCRLAERSRRPKSRAEP